MNDSILLIDKPAGMTSFGVVARVRRVLTAQAGKKVKVGHCGTLDPFATGLLILVTGKETKNAMEYTKLDKIYEATIQLGQTSSTGDPEGEMTVVNDRMPDQSEIDEVIKQYIGKVTQRPSAFSAIKINGKRAYKLARAGEKVEIPERIVEIFSLEVVDYNYPELKIRAHVSSGTYIRSLAEDIGKALDTGAYCRELRRLSIGQWKIDDATQLTELGIVD